MSSKDHQYKPVPRTESEISQEAQRRKISRARKIILTTSAAILAISLVGASIFFLWQQPTLRGHENKTHCGNSTAQARARGCKFDLLSMRWLPSACANDEWTQKFQHFVNDESRIPHPWPWFTDRNGTMQIENEAAFSERVHEHSYTTHEVHLAHCMFLWQRLHHGLQEGVVINDKTLQMSHTLHCERIVLKETPFFEIDTSAVVGFDSC